MRYLFSLLGVVVLLIVLIVVIASSNPKSATKNPINLDKYNTPSSSVSLVMSGQLVGNDERQAIEITVSQNSRNIYLLSGYNQVVASSESYPNIPDAYGVFLGALQDAGFTVARKTSEVNMFGICTTQDTYQYILSNNGSNISSLWTTQCTPATDGTLYENSSNINQLFKNQISNYSTFTQNLQYVSN